GMTRYVMCFPDVYEVGMSHLGLPILYSMFNTDPDIWCERVYSPWPDLDKIMRERNIPLFALESQDPIKDFDFLGITLQYEMCYTNILQILDLAGIPLHAADRGEDDPIVMAGGPCTYNPEPLADFFDIFYMGEGEISMIPMVHAYRENKAAGGTRKDFLRKAALIPGLYVPSLYNVEYNEDFTIKSFTPAEPGVPATVHKTVEGDLDHTYYPTKPLVPFMKVIQDRVVLEIMRGCSRGCRFCQAGMVYRPIRERSLEYLLSIATDMLDATGDDELCLSSLSSSDYSDLKPLINALIDECNKRKVNIELPSLRIDSFSLDLMARIQDIKKSSLTFAPEAGTQRMRDVINKGLTEEEIFRGAEMAFKGGWSKVKLYFMLGLPWETEEDMTGIPDLSNRIAKLYYDTVPKEERKGKVQITSSASFFVPKPFTPFQWAVMEKKDEYNRRAYLVKDEFRRQLNARSLHFQYHDADVTVIEGILVRGDRRLGKVIERVYSYGCIFDAWNEYFDYEKWMQAFREEGIDPDFYTLRERPEDEIFPWDFIDIGVTKEFLLDEWRRAKKGEVTENCRVACNGCGASCFGCGLCP
ncbi:MAG: TIGR03960 family B12-binding radical SAM protein, partial [Lachnospiraceae bacterium]|nr:TIGR03960 family B12-binding radical SAM protein [Lachnospiraceae bacterium]